VIGLSKKTARILLLAISGMALSYFSVTSANAVVITSPSDISVPYGGSVTLALQWTVTGAPGGSLTSNSGQFRIPIGRVTVLGTVQTVLNQTVDGRIGSATLTEMLTVPRDVAIRAIQLGSNEFEYRRTFMQSNGQSQSGSARIVVVSSTAAGFSISRLALSFDNDAPVRVVERKQALRANAEVTFNGSGMLQAVWEIADPASTSGEPIFRPLSLVRQHLVGSDNETVTSPALPTDTVGLYLLRLRITDPLLGFDIPVIRYFVTDQHTRGRLPPAPLGLVTPPNQSLLAPETTFVWEPIPGARAYQLELYAKARTTGDTLPDLGSSMDVAPSTLPLTLPVTGMLVPGARTRTTLSDTARGHLISGQRYLWRVLAIGNDGNIVGESAVRELRMP
jgi:hypothetical protein